MSQRSTRRSAGPSNGRILGDRGLGEVAIFASGGLGEEILHRYTGGRRADLRPRLGLTTSQDAPALDCACEIQEYAGKRRRFEGEAAGPGGKQVRCRFVDDGATASDLLTLAATSLSASP